MSKQHFCSWSHPPKYYYKDKFKKCVEFGKTFTFYAKEQKYWYETLKFNFHSQAIRCSSCRKQKRSEKALIQEFADLRSAFKESPNDPLLMLEIAKLICTKFELTGKGDLEEAISLSRKSLKADNTLLSALFWKGMAQQLLNRPAKAKPLFQKFLESTVGKPGYGKLRSKLVLRFKSS